MDIHIHRYKYVCMYVYWKTSKSQRCACSENDHFGGENSKKKLGLGTLKGTGSKRTRAFERNRMCSKALVRNERVPSSEIESAQRHLFVSNECLQTSFVRIECACMKYLHPSIATALGHCPSVLLPCWGPPKLTSLVKARNIPLFKLEPNPPPGGRWVTDFEKWLGDLILFLVD